LNTSNAAPATWPDFQQIGQSIFVDQTATRTVNDPHTGLGFSRFSRLKDIICLSCETARCRVMKSARLSRPRPVSNPLQRPSLAAFSSPRKGFIGDHFILQARAHPSPDDATDVAAPITPSVFAGSGSTPHLNLDFSPFCRHG